MTRLRFRQVLFALISFPLSSALFSQDRPEDPALDGALRLLEQGRTTLADEPLSAARAALTQLTQRNPANASYFYQLARVERYRVEALVAGDDKKGARRTLDEAIRLVQQSLALDEGSADSHSLLADLYGRKIGLGSSMFAGPKYGPKVAAENERALELDPDSPRAHASRGRQFLQAPKMFGGDVDQAIADLRRSTQLDPKSDETFVWLALALRKKGDRVGADQAVKEALRLNPDSALARSAAKE